MTVTQTILRLMVFVDSRAAFLDYATGATPAAWNATDVQFQITFVRGSKDAPVLVTDAEMADVSQVSLSVFAAARTGAPFMDKSVAMADFNTGFTIDDFLNNVDSAYHLAIDFSYLENNLAIASGTSATYWMVIHGTSVTNTPNIRQPVFGGTSYTVIEDGTEPANGPVQGNNIVPVGAMYDGSGNYTLVLTADTIYVWTKNAHDTSVTNGTETITISGSSFTTQGGSIILNGTAATTVTATIRTNTSLTQAQTDARYLRVTGENDMTGILTSRSHIEFKPIAEPVLNALAIVADGAGHIEDPGFYQYLLSFVTSGGETACSNFRNTHVSGLSGASALRLTWGAVPNGVTAIHIWRVPASSGVTTHDLTKYFLLASVAPTVTHYDDLESGADFTGRYDPTVSAPAFNTTTGNLLADTGLVCAYVSRQGLVLPAPVVIPNGNLRIKSGQLQFWDDTAAAADPTKPWRALAVDNGITIWSDPIAD